MLDELIGEFAACGSPTPDERKSPIRRNDPEVEIFNSERHFVTSSLDFRQVTPR